MQILKRIPYLGSQFFLAYMPLHVFLSQSLSLLTGGLEAWKIGKDVLLLGLTLFTVCLVFLQGRANRFFKVLVGLALLYGLLHIGLWAAHPDLYQRTAMLGTIYNVRLALLTVLGAGAVLSLSKFVFSSVIKLVLAVSTLVAALGVLQYFLPNDILTHFGYSLERGVLPWFAIDSNPLFPRIMSTLREPNALGAYLILPTLAASLLLFRTKDPNQRWVLGGVLGLHGLAILLTQSRSAWLALAVALGFGFWRQYRTWFTGFIARFWYIGAAAVVLACSAGWLIKDTHFFQAYVIHTSEARTSNRDSNELHWLFVRRGLEGIIRQPLGHGPGTAGLVSIQNPTGSFLTENYYVQIGYEVGIAGAALFIFLNVWLYIHLARRRDIWATVLLASFWAYVVTNMLLHTWSNEAVAAQWWILAGMAAIGTGVSSAAKTARTKTADR